MEHTSTAETVKAFRVTLSTLGDGFIECLSNTSLQNSVAAQPLSQRGTLSQAPVTKANNTLRLGRFGWKAQHANLVSFAGDAYLNEMGITNSVPPLAQRDLLINEGVHKSKYVLRSDRFRANAEDSSLVSFSGNRSLNKIGITNPVGSFGRRRFQVAEDVRGLRLPTIGVPERYVVFQAATTDGQTLLETALKLLALFQGITLMINGCLASVLGLIAYHRNKLDLKAKQLDLELKRLQILQIQQQLDKQARERQREIAETTRSSIILIS